MIAQLAGTLIEKQPPVLVLDVQGVGYEVEAPLSTFTSLPAVGEGVRLLTHMVVREDAHLLFGFATRTERHLFRQLLAVNGVGAKVALTILSGLTVEEFAACVARKDVKALTRVPGIGRKTAERLFVEMQDKLGTIEPSGTASVGIAGGVSESAGEQAEAALVALGFRADEARKLVSTVADEALTVEEIIRDALRNARR